MQMHRARDNIWWPLTLWLWSLTFHIMLSTSVEMNLTLKNGVCMKHGVTIIMGMLRRRILNSSS